MLSHGYDLIISFRTEDKLDSLKKELEKRYDRSVGTGALDFNNAPCYSQISQQLKDLGVSLDGLVLMPRRIGPGSEAIPEKESWESMFKTSFVNVLELIKAFLENSNKDSSRKVVLISGISSA